MFIYHLSNQYLLSVQSSRIVSSSCVFSEEGYCMPWGEGRMWGVGRKGGSISYGRLHLNWPTMTSRLWEGKPCRCWDNDCCCSVTKSYSALCNPMDTRLPCSSLSPRVCSNSCPLSQLCYPTISSSAPSSFSFSLSQHQSLFQWVDSLYQVAKVSIGASASTSVFPMNIHGWFPLGLTGLISLPSNELSRVFSSTTIQ